MLKTSIQSFLANLSNTKLYTVINLASLAISIAAVLLLSLYVKHELSYDSFHDGQRVYRAESRLWEGANLTDAWATTSYGHAPAIADNIAGIESYARVTAQDKEQVVSYAEKAYPENRYCYAEESFLKIFNFPIIEGDKFTPLDRPNCVVVSRTAAVRYFADENPIGKRLTFRTSKAEQHFEVTAIMEDMPQNSHLKYDFLLSYNTIDPARQNIWYIHGVYTYFKLQEGVSASEVEAKFSAISSQYRTAALKHKDWKIELIPLADIHLNPQKPYEKEAKGNRSMLFVLLATAIALMLVAWVNYLNLTVARAMERAREMVLRKIYGSGNVDLHFQFIFEAFITHIVAAILATFIFMVAATALQSTMGITLSITAFGCIVLLFIVILGSLIVGVYPATMLTNIRLVKIMRGNFARSPKANRLRQALVVLQFAASFVLICGTIVVVNQLSYLRNRPLGVEINQTVVVKYPAFTENMQQKEEGFRAKIKGESSVKNLTIGGAVPGIEVANYFSVREQGKDIQDAKLVQILAVDRSYIDSYNIDMASGRAFDTDAVEDENKVVINEQTARLLGFSSNAEAIGKLVLIEVLGTPLEIVGVTKNYHQQAPSQQYKPILFIIKERMAMIAVPYISIKLTPNADMNQSITMIKNHYADYFPQTPFDYFVLNDYYDNQYRSDDNSALIFATSALVALFVASIGLWVMSLFTIESRSREIRVRKIFGASKRSLFLLMLKELIIVTSISAVIGSIIVYYLMQEWLSTYAMSTTVEPWFFIIATIMLFIVGFLTIFYQILKAVSQRAVVA